MNLGDLRTFAVEQCAGDAADGKADRVVAEWINDAFALLYLDHRWRWFRETKQIVLEAVVTGTALTATQGSAVISVAAPDAILLSRYVTEGWELQADAADQITFRFASINPTNPREATLDTEWIDASVAGTGDYDLVRWRYPLTGQRIEVVYAPEGNWEVCYLEPADFDRRRYEDPLERNSDPLVYTYREEHVEIWPPPTADRVMIVTYSRPIPSYKVTDPDSTVVDWRNEWAAMLKAAIKLKAAEYRGEEAQTSLTAALLNYRRMLSRFRDEDSRHVTGDKTVRLGRERRPWRLRQRREAQ